MCFLLPSSSAVLGCGSMYICVSCCLVPLQSWGGSFNFSIWHVQLWGVAESSQVENALAKLMQVSCILTDRTNSIHLFV